MSQHIGDMENLETLEAFEASVAHFEHIFRVQPELIACDLHPDYLSTRWALARAGEMPVRQVQHHHAHIAALLGEHQHDGRTPVIGISFDGTGYGTDGAIWGGEALLATYREFERVAHLAYMPQAGGDAAVRRPYRLALAYLWAADLPWNERLAPVAACPPAEREVLRRQLETDLNTIPTSSMGRLFDAVAALAGVRQVVTYEAQAAIEFEALVDPAEEDSYHFDLSGEQIDLMAVVGAGGARRAGRRHPTADRRALPQRRGRSGPARQPRPAAAARTGAGRAERRRLSERNPAGEGGDAAGG